MSNETELLQRRDELLAKYPNGYIRRPGKFEGEPIWAAFYFDLAMNGFEDETLDNAGTLISVYFVDATDRRVWDLSDDTTAVAIWESDSGFVMHAEWTENEYLLAQEDCEGSDGEPDESEES